MTPYLILIFLPVAFLFVLLEKQYNRRVIVIGVGPEVQNNSLMIPTFFVICFLLLVLRHESIGSDTWNYRNHFQAIAGMSLWQTLRNYGDTLYYALNWLVTRFTEDFGVYLILVSALTLLPIVALYAEDRENSFLKMILFINMPVFIMIFSGLRQSLAFSMGVIAYKYVRERKVWKFLLWALI